MDEQGPKSSLVGNTKGKGQFKDWQYGIQERYSTTIYCSKTMYYVYLHTESGNRFRALQQLYLSYVDSF